MTRPQLAAALIVRNEAGMLPGCLDSLAGVVDEIHVHDTGSKDGTRDVAARFGAIVTQGGWADDFAAARTDAQRGWSAEWVLAVDADHRVHVEDPSALRAFLASASGSALLVQVDNVHDFSPYTQWQALLYRPERVVWEGRVHEQITESGPVVPGLRLEHLGFATGAARVRRAERNLRLAQIEFDQNRSAKALYDMGRNFAGSDRRQQAVDTFEAVRELFPNTPEWLYATDFLARILLGAGMYEVVVVLAEQLRENGARSDYCDWLAGQAWVQLGDVPTAAALLGGVTEVIDTGGRRRDPEALRELKELVHTLTVICR